MKRFVMAPHDIRQMCIDCGTTLEGLAAQSGFTEGELLQVAAGKLALSATERYLIVTLLIESASTSDRVTPRRRFEPSVDSPTQTFDDVMAEHQEIITDAAAEAFNTLFVEAEEENPKFN